MKKTITIICDIETTITNLLNTNDFDVYPAEKNDLIVTMIKKEVEPSTININGIDFQGTTTLSTN